MIKKKPESQRGGLPRHAHQLRPELPHWAACNAAPSRPGLPLIRLVRFTALITAVEPQQPGYHSHSDAVVHQSTAPHTDNLIVS